MLSITIDSPKLQAYPVLPGPVYRKIIAFAAYTVIPRPIFCTTGYSQGISTKWHTPLHPGLFKNNQTLEDLILGTPRHTRARAIFRT
jgi:hypothetical protein